MDYKLYIGSMPTNSEYELDVTIEFNDGAEYVVTFYTLTSLKYLLESLKSVDKENWIIGAKDMIIIEAFEKSQIENSLENIISNEPYWDIFTECNSKAVEHNRLKRGRYLQTEEETANWLDGIDEALENRKTS
ncbi:MAG: hypothetical protein ACPGJS_12640 [Flammeovirgaceae bacterium]